MDLHHLLNPAAAPPGAASAGAAPRTAAPPFALLRREGRDHVEILTGTLETVARLADIPLRAAAPAGPQVLALVPHRQVRERGFECVDDGAPLTCLCITAQATVPVDDALRALPAEPAVLTGGGFDIDDEAYADTVRAVLRDEIGRGEGANFVIHRTYEASVAGSPLLAALAVFRRLLLDEQGAYWTFLVHTGERTFVGASPERHVSVEDGLVMMNPISGTYRHGSDVGLLEFLRDPKEVEELYMVLDEELKMMATVADEGGQVVGPYLKEMAHLTHTEYLLVGRGSRDVREVLRETMFAPTVVGSPLENACRVIARHERRGRGYYGGVVALLGTDDAGRQTVDAPILIRTAEFHADGRLRVPVGATLVRHSTPEGEIAETHTKAAGVLSALGLRPRRTGSATGGTRAAADPVVQALLAARNDTLARFWLDARDAAAGATPRPSGALAGRRVLVIDNEDTFTGMLAHQLRALGLDVTLRSYRQVAPGAGVGDGYDLVVAGPGPGDPGDPHDPKMRSVRGVVVELLAGRRPLLAICLGHQVLAAVLGLPVHRKDAPYQGLQRTIDFFGRASRVGFYCTFTAVAEADEMQTAYGPVEFSRDAANGEVHALRGPAFAGVQFHPESVLSEHGVDLLYDLVSAVLATPAPAAEPDRARGV